MSPSNDMFGSFKAGLVGLGRETFRAGGGRADALADHRMVQAIAAGQIDPFALAAEEIQFAASYAFQQHTGDADAFWEALEARPDEPGDEDAPTVGDQWPGRFGSADDAAQIPVRLPRLLALFPGRVPSQRRPGCGCVDRPHRTKPR